MHTLSSLAFMAVCACVITLTRAELCTKDVCEFELDIRRIRTMTYAKKDGSGSYNVELEAGTNKLKIVPNSLRLDDGTDPLINTYVNKEDVVTAGGHIRNVITINHQFPGPAIEVMEGAEVIVKVTNHLRFDGVSIHWHGLYMRKTPWMDGVAYITQCPIPPRQSFTYRFRAYPPGTHWYHAHLENLRVDGLYGMFVIHQQLPSIPQHHAMIADWWHMTAETIEILNPWAVHFKGTGEMHLPVPDRDYTVDGVQLGAMDHTMYTTIINGRGKGQNGEAFPLEVYNVAPNGRSRVRVVHAGAEYAYYVSVDGHTIDVVASDGYELNPIKVTHIIIQPGESTDFVITADQTVGNYWMRVRTIRDGKTFDVIPDGIVREGLAIVRYNGATEVEPTTTAAVCTQQTPCTIFNCPFAGYADSHYKTCKTFNDAKSAIPKARLDSEYGVSDSNFEEYFFTFAFAVGSGVNGKKFINPTVPLYQPFEENIVECGGMECDLGCRCTQFQKLPFNKTVQMVFSNVEPGQTVFSHHPIHVHGHGFAVLKVGYPEYDTNTGKWTSPNDDLICSDRYCNPARWNGAAPTDLNQANPPVKDTITIPARGYVVLRFRTDNPGFWLVHCHAEQHIMDGMAIVFNEAPELHPDVPTKFPKCEDFKVSDDEYSKYDSTPYGQKPQMGEDKEQDKDKDEGDKDKEEEEEDMGGNRRLEDDEFAVKLPLAIGTAVGFILLGAVIAIVPVMCLMLFRRKQEAAAVAGKGTGYTNNGFTT